MKTATAKNVDEYISVYPKDVQKLLEEIRVVIKKAAPDAEETIKYAIPTYVQNGNVLSFAAFKNHIGFYPAPRGVPEFEKALTKYEGAKATARFPINEPLPLTLISKMTKFLVKRSLEKKKTK
ncbi:MAG TPA: DUF1801 domain-containing protein, partial [Chryseolinea sp.]|nr:DUF1801 domain-containing protein [Chryseolinea sp.]